MWNEELLLPIATEATSSVASVLLELRSGSADASKSKSNPGDRASAGSIVGFATIEWSAVHKNATGTGWAVEPPLLSASGASLGGKLLVRLLFTDAAASAQQLRVLKSQLSEAMSTASKERMALSAAAEEQQKQLAVMRAQLGLKLRTVTTRSTEKEVSAFRNALEARLAAARKGRDSVLHNYSDMHQKALGEAMPRVAERLQRSSQQQEELIERVSVRARKKMAAAAEVRHTQWAEAIPKEREKTVAKLMAKTGRAVHRIHAAFRKTAAHEGSTLGRRLRKIAHEAEERAARECMTLHKQSDAQLSMVAAGRAEIDAEAREVASAVRLELGRLSSEWQAALSAHYAAGREQLGRQLLDFQATHREQRAARRVVDAAADNARKAVLSRRATLLAERSSATQKEMDALGGWLAKRLEAARASAATVDASGSLGRPVDASPRRIEFEAELGDVRSRAELQRSAMQQLYTRLFAARARGAVGEQVREVMKACETRGLEIMADTSKISSSAVVDLEAELATLAAEVGKRHDESLSVAYAEAEGYERALVAPSIREAPKHAALLAQLSHELQQSLQLALSRPAEWFEILSRSLKLDEQMAAEREGQLRLAMHNHASELSAHSALAAEEVQTEEQLMLKREKQLTADAQLMAERIASERRTLLADQGARPDVAALMHQAMDAKRGEGEARLLERKRVAAERLDLPHRPKHPEPSMGGEAAEQAGGGNGGGGGSLDARRRTRGVGGAGRDASAASSTLLLDLGLPGRLRDHYHQLLAEAAAYRPAGSRVLEWSEDAAAGRTHGLSHAESDKLLAIEAQLQSELKEAVLAEHAAFASAASELASKRESLRLGAANTPAPITMETAAAILTSDDEVARADRHVEKARSDLAAKTAARDVQDVSVRTTVQEARASFTAAFDDARKSSDEVMAHQLAARDQAGDEGVRLRSGELAARDETTRRLERHAAEEWQQSLDKILSTSRSRLEPVRKRLAIAKRGLAAELIGALREESDGRSEGFVKLTMALDAAREDGRESFLSALVSTHEEEAAALAALRLEQLEHLHGVGDWEKGGLLATLMSVGAIKSNAMDMTALPVNHPAAMMPRPLATFADPARQESHAKSETAPLHVPESAIGDLADGARKRFEERPEAAASVINQRLVTKRVRAAGPMAAPPLPTVDVSSVLSEVEATLGEGSVWAAPTLHAADKMTATIKRASPPAGMPSVEDIRRDDEEDALLAAPPQAAEPTEADRANARRRAELMSTTMMHNAQKRALETQAEADVAEERRPALEVARELADLRREEAAATYQDEELYERRQTADAKQQLVEDVERRVQSAGTGYGRSAQLWAEALLRRQAEETTMHARRLRHEAHMAASGKLGPTGEQLKKELAGVRALTESVKGALAASAS